MNSDINSDAFWDRLKAAIGRRSNRSVADQCGLSEGTIRRYLRKETYPSLDKIRDIAKVTEVNTDWLLTGEGPMRQGETALAIPSQQPQLLLKEEDAPEFISYEDATEQTQQHIDIPQWPHPDADAFHYVPMAKAKLCAGGGMFVLSEDVSDYYAFRKTWLKRISTSPKSVVLMEVQGNSMAPTILDKDTVMIDTGRLEIIEGMIYAIRLDQTIMIKRLTHRPGGIINVISDNKEEFEPYQAHRKDVHIIGQIIYFSRDLISGY